MTFREQWNDERLRYYDETMGEYCIFFLSFFLKFPEKLFNALNNNVGRSNLFDGISVKVFEVLIGFASTRIPNCVLLKKQF